MNSLHNKDLYAILGVVKSAKPNELRRSYLALAVKYHPDRNPGDPLAEERFKDISHAYAILSDPTARARYERLYHKPSSSKTYTSTAAGGKSAEKNKAPGGKTATGPGRSQSGANSSSTGSKSAGAGGQGAAGSKSTGAGSGAGGQGAAGSKSTGAGSGAGGQGAAGSKSTGSGAGGQGAAGSKSTGSGAGAGGQGAAGSKSTGSGAGAGGQGAAGSAGASNTEGASAGDFDEIVGNFFKSNKGQETLRDLENELNQAGLKFKTEDFTGWLKERQQQTAAVANKKSKKKVPLLSRLTSWLLKSTERGVEQPIEINIQYQISLSAEAAKSGTTVEISYQNGDATQPIHLKVKVPAETKDGTQLRLGGQGRLGDDGGRGDLILTVLVAQKSAANFWN